MITPPVITPEKYKHRLKRPRLKLRINRRGAAMLLAINTFVLTLFMFPMFNGEMHAISTPFSSFTPALEITTQTTGAATSLPRQTSEPTLTLNAVQESVLIPAYPLPGDLLLTPGTIFMAMDDGPYSHLFAYQPQTLPLTRLTYGTWEDITPALNPNGDLLAFSSNRNGYWNLYLLDLKSGLVTQLTDSPQYEAAPSWSPDGRWLVYETYLGGDDGGLELFILPIDDSSPPIRLTDHPAPDYSPSWSPGGRQIAFVSQRSGHPGIWIVDLDVAGEDRFWAVNNNPTAIDSHPVWSPDGKRLAWSSNESGFHNLYMWESTEYRSSFGSKMYLGSGSYPVWSPDGESILTLLMEPNDSYLTAYYLAQPYLALPPVVLPGMVSGLTWGVLDPGISIPGPFAASADQNPAPAWQTALTPAEDVPAGRYILAQLDDVSAPYPKLHDMVDEAFAALRLRAAFEAGWDYLSTLENAFLPLTSPSLPGMKEDWLHTGRAFASNSLPLNAGWMVIVREDHTHQTYWRVYLKAFAQDGSAGRPLYAQPWDFNARYSGNMMAYEQGGALSINPPSGYWVDFTQIARRYGWDRLPALSIWRSTFPSARFNQFKLDSGLDWKSAMLEIYPPEVLVTPTPLIAPTRTPSPTPPWYQTPTPSITPTSRPTLTPPPPTPTDTPTLVPTQTPIPTLTWTPVATAQSTAAPSRTPLRSP